MPSGKQLSFYAGEVSPAYRYKSSSVAYTEGLHKLRNGFPRIGGGVSNRSGFKYVRTLDNYGIRPKGIQSNTRLFFQKRREFLGEDTSKKHSGDLYFIFENNPPIVGDPNVTSMHIYQAFSDFSLDRTRITYDTKSSRVRESNLVAFEDDIYLTFRDIGILRIPYDKMFDPRKGTSRLEFLSDDDLRINVEVSSNYFDIYNSAFGDGTARVSSRRMLVVQADGTSGDINSSIQSVYLISEQKVGGQEQIVCGYQGTFTSFQGEAIKFILIDGLTVRHQDNAVGNSQANQVLRSLQYNRLNGALLLVRGNTATLSRNVDGSVLPPEGERTAIVVDPPPNTFIFRPDFQLQSLGFNKINAYRPAKGRYIYRLYRGFSLGSAVSLVDTVFIDYEELNKLSNIEAFIQLNDFSSAGGSASRSFRDGLRLYGGVGDDTVDTQFFDYRQVDYGFFLGGHRFYRPTVPTESGGRSRFIPFVHVRELMRYQQRTFASYIDKGPSDAENTLRSVIGVSAINSKHNFSTAPVVNPVNAFEFNIPLGDASPVVAMLGAERPLIFTLNNVYMLLGADSGIITPTEINPTVIYTGGCSEIVRPVLVDNRVFFLNNDHTSLVMIAFNESGGRGVQVIETDEKAKHFLEMNIIQIAVVKSFDTIIWLLTTEGDLISITMHSGNRFGYALHTISDGFIENISSARYPYLYHPTTRNNAWTTPDVEVLAATIVRDGARTLEIMTGRDDRLSENMGYMDGFTSFGTRLTAREDGYYYDQERSSARFQQIYDSELSTEIASDMNEIFRVFGNFVRNAVSTLSPRSWVEYTLGDEPAGESDINSLWDYPYLQYFANTITRIVFRKPYTFAGEVDPDNNGGYDDGIETQQRINITPKDDDGFHTVEFSALHSLYSLIPRRLTASSSSTQEDEIQARLIYMYFDVLQRFAREESSAIEAWSVERRSLLGRLIAFGYVLDFKSPEYIRYYAGGSVIILKKVSAEDTITAPDYIDTGEIGDAVPARDNTIPAYKRSQSYGATTTREYSRISTGSRSLGTARIPIPQQNPARTFLVKAKYAPVGNEEIPEEFLDVENNPNISADNKFRFTTNWSPMVNEVTGLAHLANKKVAVFADNEVVSSPLSERSDVANQALTVDNNGTLKLKDYYQWGIVGIPYKFEMETLQIETQDERALISGKKLMNKLNVALNRTREGVRTSAIKGFEYNPEVDASYPLFDEKVREDSIDPKNGTFSGVVEPSLAAGWSEGGRVRITNADPTPVTVNAIYPKGIDSGE